MADWTHHHAVINGIGMHYVAQGEGPLLILCHGFPHLWLSWHRQIPVLAAQGWRVVAPDLRGMGQTEAPADMTAYDCEHTVGDLLGLLDHLGAQQAVFAGLDFGIFAIYDLAWRHPQRVRAMIALQNPFWPDRAEISPLAEAADWASRHFVHIHYFVSVGSADRDLAAAPREFLQKVFYALSADYHYLDVWKHPPGTTYLAALPEAPPLPWSWLSEWELEWFVSEYSRSGFTGGLNWYRAMDVRWEQRRPYRGTRSQVPFYLIASQQDVDLEAWHGDNPLGALEQHHAQVRRVAMVKGGGHMLQLECAEQVTAAMQEFLQDIAAQDRIG